MMNEPKQDQENEGRERLMRAALTLFSERSFGDVAIHEIAEAAGMTRSAPYYHFRNKEDLYAAVMRRQFATLYRELSARLVDAPTFRDQLLVITDVIIAISGTPFGRFMDDFRLHMSERVQRSIMRDTPHPIQFFLPIFQQAYASGEFRRIQPEFAVRLFFMELIGYREIETRGAGLLQWQTELPPLTPGILVDAFLKGI